MSLLTGVKGRQEGADLLGIDILRDTERGDVVESLGALYLSQGEEVALADIAERLRTGPGGLFYDYTFTGLIDDWVEAPDLPEHRARLETQVEITVEADPRVVPGSARATVTTWQEEPRIIRVDIEWRWIETQHAGNMVIQIDSEGVKRVAAAHNPRPDEEAA